MDDLWNYVNAGNDEYIDDDMSILDEEQINEKIANKKQFMDIDALFNENSPISKDADLHYFFPNFVNRRLSSRDHPIDHRMDSRTEAMSIQSDDAELYPEGEIDRLINSFKIPEKDKALQTYIKNLICTSRFMGKIERSHSKIVEFIKERYDAMGYFSIVRANEVINHMIETLLESYTIERVEKCEIHAFKKFSHLNETRPFDVMDMSVYTDLREMESMMYFMLTIDLDQRFRILYDDDYIYDKWTDEDKKLASMLPIPISQLIKQGAIGHVPTAHCPIDWYVPFPEVRMISYSILQKYVPKPSSSMYQQMVTAAGPYMSIWENELSLKVNIEWNRTDVESFGLSEVAIRNEILDFGDLREKYMQQYAYIQLAKRISRRYMRRARAAAMTEHLLKNRDLLLLQCKRSMVSYYRKRKPSPGPIINEANCTKIINQLDKKWMDKFWKYVDFHCPQTTQS